MSRATLTVKVSKKSRPEGASYVKPTKPTKMSLTLFLLSLSGHAAAGFIDTIPSFFTMKVGIKFDARSK